MGIFTYIRNQVSDAVVAGFQDALRRLGLLDREQEPDELKIIEVLALPSASPDKAKRGR